MKRWTMGVDIGSVTVKFLLLDEQGEVRFDSYLRTDGAPLEALTRGLAEVREELPADAEISAVGTTGSGRYLAAAFLGGDLAKNEITTHAVGVLSWNPEVRTIIEIGGQDSKIIHLMDGSVTDFAMNTVCAAGTGAFLDQQATRLNIPIERFGEFALTAEIQVRIAGRCSVFAESDMIHKQQAGYDKASICMGLCQALVRNYMNNVVRGKRLYGPISLQGGVAFNRGIIRCFEDALPGQEIVIPPHVTGCGALGAAILAREEVGDGPTNFRGWETAEYRIRPYPCGGCDNECEVLSLIQDRKSLARWGGRCEKGNSLRGRNGSPASDPATETEDPATETEDPATETGRLV